MKSIISFVGNIESNKRSAFARYSIIIGILMAYSPYWMKLFMPVEEAGKIADMVVAVGWWVLTPGVVFYFFNIWLNLKLDKTRTDAAE